MPSVSSATVQRFNQVYVDVPPLPYITPKSRKMHYIHPPNTPATPSGLFKENSRVMRLSTPLTIPKRKPDTEFCVEIPTPCTKIAKLSAASPHANSSRGQENAAPSATRNLDMADGMYCHQCGRKHSKSRVVVCMTSGSDSKRRCHARYCMACLKNRYGETLQPDRRNAYQCPRCRGVCNCTRCRKSQGLAPLGKTAIVPSSNTIKVANQSPTAEPRGRSKHSVSTTSPQELLASSTTFNPTKTRPKPKPLPYLNWSAISTDLTFEQAEERFQIREFILRFGVLFSYPLSKAHLRELNEIDGAYSAASCDDHIGWVSEGCAKAIIVGLLGLLVDGQNETSIKAIKAAMKHIRSSGVNLTKIWAILAELRGTLPDGALLYPDPLPVSPAQMRMTRNTHITESQIFHVACAAQLVPTIIGLQETSLTSQAIRQELDEGVQEGKEWTKASRDAIRKEKEQFDMQRKDITEGNPVGGNVNLKAARLAHAQRVGRIECSAKVLSFAYAPRSGHLGRDIEGRSYWALSPDMAEREAALAFLKGEKNGKSPRSLTGEDSRNWSLFVSVWGTKPGDPDNEGDKWWSFRAPGEIRKLSEWLGINYRLDEDNADYHSAGKDSQWTVDGRKTILMNTASSQELRMLVKGLKDYASLVEFRTDTICKD